MNGTEPMILPKMIPGEFVPEQIRRPLTVPQQKQLLRLVNILGRAQEAQEAAQRHLDTSQQNANDFLVYCAEEAGIVLGQEGWRFEQGALCFVQDRAESYVAAAASHHGAAHPEGSRGDDV